MLDYEEVVACCEAVKKIGYTVNNNSTFIDKEKKECCPFGAIMLCKNVDIEKLDNPDVSSIAGLTSDEWHSFYRGIDMPKGSYVSERYDKKVPYYWGLGQRVRFEYLKLT
jgi:hypothetical protein